MTPREILNAAHDLISDRSAWVQDRFALDASGEETYATSPTAVCFCTSAAIDRAIYRVHGADAPIGARHEARSILEFVMGAGICDFNDTHTHDEVTDAFKRAIEIAR